MDVPQSTTELLRVKRRLEEGRLIATRKRVRTRSGSSWKTARPIPWREPCNSAMSRWIPTTGSVILRMVFPNPEGVLLPGMFVRAVVKEGVNEQAILVPQQGVSRDPKGDPYALVVDAEGKVGHADAHA